MIDYSPVFLKGPSENSSGSVSSSLCMFCFGLQNIDFRNSKWRQIATSFDEALFFASCFLPSIELSVLILEENYTFPNPYISTLGRTLSSSCSSSCSSSPVRTDADSSPSSAICSSRHSLRKS